MRDLQHDDVESIFVDLDALRLEAEEIRPKRRAHAELHELIGRCLLLCERAEKAGCIEILKERATSRAGKRNRTYFEKSADIFLVVGRLVFEVDKGREASYRYTSVMREARKKGISGQELPAWLQKNGGLNALFRPRNGAKAGQTKTLFLSDPVHVPASGEITLRLMRQPNGFFKVLEQRGADG